MKDQDEIQSLLMVTAGTVLLVIGVIGFTLLGAG